MPVNRCGVDYIASGIYHRHPREQRGVGAADLAAVVDGGGARS